MFNCVVMCVCSYFADGFRHQEWHRFIGVMYSQFSDCNKWRDGKMWIDTSTTVGQSNIWHSRIARHVCWFSTIDHYHSWHALLQMHCVIGSAEARPCEWQNFCSLLKPISVTSTPTSHSIPHSSISPPTPANFFTRAHCSAPAYQIFGPLRYQSNVLSSELKKVDQLSFNV